jgi:hypothetical protein
MGQYYRFINRTKDQESNIPLPFNFGLPWAKALEYDSGEELREKFDFVIKGNHWEKTDEIAAVGDYGNVIDSPFLETI